MTTNETSPVLKAFLGYGVLRPFRRDGRGDFANGGGFEVVKSAVGQILGTRASSESRQGETPWRPEFGSLLHFLRHRPNTFSRGEIARAYIQEALHLWEPRVRVVDVTTEGEDRTRRLRVVFDVIDRNVPGNNVIARGLEVTLPIANR